MPDSSTAEKVKGPDDIKIHRVRMSEFTRLDIPHDDKNTYLLRTEARAGCDAVLVWRVDSNGNDQILLTHYPPTEFTIHSNMLNQHSPKGEGNTRVVYLTFGLKDDEYTRKMEKVIEEATGVIPDVVRLSDLTNDNVVKDMQRNRLLFQLTVIKGLNGNPSARRIEVPIPQGYSQGAAYLKDF